MSLCLFLRSFSAIWVLLHHLTWQCNNKRQGRTESLDRPSELLRTSSKFDAKKQTHSNQISTCPPPSKEENLKNTPSFRTADENNFFLKISSLLGGGCLEIRLNEQISPSPSEFLVDASTQSPTSDKTVEMFHFLLATDKWRQFLNCSWSFW